MSGLLELIVEALYYHSVGVIFVFGWFVVDENFITLLDRHIVWNVIRVFAWVNGLPEGLIEALNIHCFRHHDAQKSGLPFAIV